MARQGCTVPVRELTGCLGEESGVCAKGTGHLSHKTLALVSSIGVGRPWKLVTRKAAMGSGLAPL